MNFTKLGFIVAGLLSVSLGVASVFKKKYFKVEKKENKAGENNTLLDIITDLRLVILGICLIWLAYYAN